MVPVFWSGNQKKYKGRGVVEHADYTAPTRKNELAREITQIGNISALKDLGHEEEIGDLHV